MEQKMAMWCCNFIYLVSCFGVVGCCHCGVCVKFLAISMHTFSNIQVSVGLICCSCLFWYGGVTIILPLGLFPRWPTWLVIEQILWLQQVLFFSTSMRFIRFFIPRASASCFWAPLLGLWFITIHNHKRCNLLPLRLWVDIFGERATDFSLKDHGGYKMSFDGRELQKFIGLCDFGYLYFLNLSYSFQSKKNISCSCFSSWCLLGLPLCIGPLNRKPAYINHLNLFRIIEKAIIIPGCRLLGTI